MASTASPERIKDSRGESEEGATGTRRRSRMKRKSVENHTEKDTKRTRTFDDFFNFCSFVLAYEEELERQAISNGAPSPPPPSTLHPSPTHSSPLHSRALTNGEEVKEELGRDERERKVEEGREDSSLSPSSDQQEKLEYTSEDESWNLVTCFCRRPFAGRPMIECSQCTTWIHLFCAKIRKDEVPDVYICPTCRSHKTTGGGDGEGGGRKGRRQPAKES